MMCGMNGKRVDWLITLSGGPDGREQLDISLAPQSALVYFT